MKKSLKRQSNKIDLSHMRHPKPLSQRSRSSSVSPDACKPKSNFIALSKSRSKQNDKYSEILNKVLSIQINQKTNHVLLRKHLTLAIEPHILILNEALKSRDEIGKSLLKNGKFLKKCCQILEQNPYCKFENLLQFIRKTHLPHIIQNKSEFQRYFESKLQKYNQSQEEAIVIKYDLNGNQIKEIPILNQSNKKQDNKDSQLSDEQSAIVTKYDMNGNQILKQQSPSFSSQQNPLPNIPTQHFFVKQPPQTLGHRQSCLNIKKIPLNLQMIPKKGILKPSKYKLSQSPQKSIQTNSNQLYPDFDDYNVLLNEKENHSENILTTDKKIETPKHQTLEQTHLHHIKNTMMRVFKINTIYNIQDLNIVGIIQTDYDKMGQYGVMLVSEKQDKNKRQILVVFPLKSEVNQEALLKVKSRFASILGWVINDKNIDLNEYWAQNLDNILPS